MGGTRDLSTHPSRRSLQTLTTNHLKEIKDLGKLDAPQTVPHDVHPSSKLFTFHTFQSSMVSPNPFSPLLEADMDEVHATFPQPPDQANDASSTTSLHKNPTPITNGHQSSSNSSTSTTPTEPP